MREIKFRAWDGERMMDDNSLQWVDGRFISGVWNWEETEIVDGICEPEIMQYTGLKDRNGKEIYEGDIVQPKSFQGSMFGMAEVAFHQGRFCLLRNPPFVRHKTTLREAINRSENANNGLQIIGNIHENPELLES